MCKAKLFENGRSQAVRLPKEYRFEGNEVEISKVGDIVLLIPKSSKWSGFLKSLDMFTNDFMEERNQEPIEKRKEL